MINVYPAVEARYESHPVLYRTGRLLREGSEGKEHLPFTTVIGGMTGDLSTFDTDIEQWELTFTLHSKVFKPDDVREWLEGMRDAFHTVVLVDPLFTCNSCVVTNQTGPEIADEQYTATTTAQVILSRSILTPYSRDT